MWQRRRGRMVQNNTIQDDDGTVELSPDTVDSRWRECFPKLNDLGNIDGEEILQTEIKKNMIT